MRVSNAGSWSLGKNHTFQDVFNIIESWKMTHLNRFYSCPPSSADQTIRDGSGNPMTFKDFVNKAISVSGAPDSPVAISPRLPWDIVTGTESCAPPGGTGISAFKAAAKKTWEFQSQLTPPQTAVAIDNSRTGVVSASLLSSMSKYLRSLGFEHISWAASGNTAVSSSAESDWAMCLAYDRATRKLMDTNTSAKGNCNLKILQKQGWYLSYQAQIDYPYEFGSFVLNFGGGSCLGPCLDPKGKQDIGYCDLTKCNGTKTWDGVAGAFEQLASMQSSMAYTFVYPIIEGPWDSAALTTSKSGSYGGKSLYTVMYDLAQKYNT